MKVFTFAPFGYEGALVEVEVDVRDGIPAMDIVGLADSEVKAARELVQSVIKREFEMPDKRVLIALSPCDLRKDYNMALPIATAILTRDIDGPDTMVLGELTIDGMIRPVRAVHAAVATALANGITHFVVPKDNENEVLAFDGVEVISTDNLSIAVNKMIYNDFQKTVSSTTEIINGVEFSNEVEWRVPNGKGKELLAMAIAAAGKHNILFYGAPGCGKTMLLQNMPSLLPLLTREESMSVTLIHSLAGLMKLNERLKKVRPFRMPHQTASIEGICGGGPNCRPGEISLAHNGALFLDEAAEFRSSVLQMLRVPLESRSITLSRAGRSTVYPADFQLLMAMNPCPCGNYGSPNKVCLCSARSVEQYWRKISDPLLDRIEIRMSVEKESDNYERVELRQKIANAVNMQRARGVYNGRLTPQDILNYCELDKKTSAIMDKAVEEKQLTPRRISSIAKLARTIADMEMSEKIKSEHLKLAIELNANTPLND